MPPRKGVIKLPLLKYSKYTCTTEACPDLPKVPEPVSESGSKEDEDVVSPAPSDDSASKSDVGGRCRTESEAKNKKKTKTYTQLIIAQQEAIVDWLKTRDDGPVRKRPLFIPYLL